MIPVALADIASIEVLKDGSSTALYGAEGANGVILIETKKGKPQKMGLTYQFNQSFINNPSYAPMLNGDEYIMYQLESMHNAGIAQIPIELCYDRDYSGFYNYSANTNWIEAVTQPGNASNHFLNVYGGNEKSRYYGSINFTDQKGTVINTGYNRLSGRLNFEHYITDKLTFTLQLSNSFNKHEGNVELNNIDILQMAFIKAPNMSIWEYDSLGIRTGDYFSPMNSYQGNGRDYYNPVAVSDLGKSENTLNDFISTGRLHYNFNNWLSFNETFSYFRSSVVSESYLPDKAIDNGWLSWGVPIINNNSELVSDQYRNEIQALLNIPFKDEKKNGLSGTFTWIRQGGKNKIEYDDFDNRFEWKRNAAISSVFYELLDRYVLNVNSRFESIYYDRHIWDKHYGIVAGWRFSNEPLLKSFSFLNRGFIHTGWSFAKYHPFEYYQSVFSAHESEIQAQSCNLGIEFGLFRNRIHLSADYYNKLSTQESTKPISAVKLKSQGWEGMFSYEFIKTRNFSWGTNFNIAYNNSIVLEAPINSQWGMLINGRYLGQLENNKPLGSIYGLVFDGLYATDQDAIARDQNGNILYDNEGAPRMIQYDYYGTHHIFQGGDAKYRDINYDGIINEEDVVYLGNSYPKYIGGFGSTLQFKNLSLTCNFHYRSGYQVINQVAMESEGLISNNNQSKEELNRWRMPGQGGTDLLPRAFRDHPANNLGSDKFVGNGGFIRMNYISLGYNLNPEICNKIHLKDLFLSLSAQRLFTLTNYDGLDPEIEMESYGWHRDVIRSYPPKIYTLSIQITL